MSNFYFDNKKNFIIEDYDKTKPFSSFLPGVAGLKGIPLWAFYVNRGQGICSFGIENKHHPIMEFSPANVSYQTVSTNGFRSFVKVDGRELYEPFTSQATCDNVDRIMSINESEFTISEINHSKGIEYKVTYFGLPSENFAALVRKVDVKNISDQEISLEIIDGLSAILPYGIKNEDYKSLGNLLRSWMDVYNLDNNIPFYKLRATTGDEAEVGDVQKGHFYLSFSEEGELLKPIVDAGVLFGLNTSLSIPDNFVNQSIEALLEMEQITANKVPCGFSAVKKVLQANESLPIRTMIGNIEDIKLINNRASELANIKYFDSKERKAKKIITDLTDGIETKTGYPRFDEYIRQCYLDNILRGGYPIILDNDQDGFVYHVYSRKHGDLEREYNFFSIAPEFYSQGNGNFRDANQNRRNDILFNPRVGDYNVKTFMSLIQIDGYNPLLVKGTTFEIMDKDSIKSLVDELFDSHKEAWQGILRGRFTPGRIVNYISHQQVELITDEEDVLKKIMSVSRQNIEATFGEGFWSDHWTYNMDLVDTYLRIYPDKRREFLFDDMTYTFFDSPVHVLPRSEKYVLTKDNKVRQYGAVIEDEEKMERLGINIEETNWLRTEVGRGEIYRTNLFVKLFSLGINKFIALDPQGIGLEMESNKPGWNDAMNGLSGLFGSGLSETVELKRLLEFLKEQCQGYKAERVNLPEEVEALLNGLEAYLQQNLNNKLSDFDYWDRVYTLKETYREAVRYGITGKEVEVSVEKVGQLVEKFIAKIEKGLLAAKEIGNGLYPTFFYFEATDYEAVVDEDGEPMLTHYGLPKVKVNSFEIHALPYFLEGPARALKGIKDVGEAKDLYDRVKNSNIYDEKLSMYKTSQSLDECSNEIGRIRAFTPGWLERESVFLHMTYKYLLGTLKAGLYDEFFTDLKTNMVAFLDPAVYGRSVLENSSFIASSVNPNPSLHGQGFVARLTGTTSEAISIWFYMMVGSKVFSYENGELTLEFRPVIPGEFFDEDGQIEFMFLNQTRVVYINKNKGNTYGENRKKVSQIELMYLDKRKLIMGSKIVGDDAINIRDGNVAEIRLTFE